MRRNLALIAIFAACGCLVAAAITYAKGAVFEATISIAVDEVPAGYSAFMFANRARTLDTDAALLVSDHTLSSALESANSAEPVAALRDRIVVNAIAESNVLVVTVSDKEPESAATMATEIAQAFITERRTEYDLALARSMVTLRSYYDSVWRGIEQGMLGAGKDPSVRAVVRRTTQSSLITLDRLFSDPSARPPPEDQLLRLNAPQARNQQYPGLSQRITAGAGAGCLLACLLMWLRKDNQVSRHRRRVKGAA
ncbi:MAG: hypothetical protein ACR2GB_07645 [Nocardioidaceae bacterium]